MKGICRRHFKLLQNINWIYKFSAVKTVKESYASAILLKYLNL